MRALVALVFVLLLVAAGAAQLSSPALTPRSQTTAGAACHHGQSETEEHRARRQQALAVARALNIEQGRFAEHTREYLPLAHLPKLPEVPDGFELRFYTDGSGYIFSLKDQRDPCRFGIFSDQHGQIYEVTPQVPQIAS